MKRRTWLWVGAAAVAAAGVLAWALAPRPVPVEVAAVRQQRFEQTIDEDGKTRVRQRYVVSAPLAGRLARITLRAGDPVKAGQAVAEIAPAAPALLDARAVRELQERVGMAEASLVQARADLGRAESALAQAQADLTRQRKLESEGFLSPNARELAELAVRTQTRALEAADATRHAAEHNLAQARAALIRVREPGAAAGALPVTAPVSGRVLRLLQESEAVVALGTPLLELADPSDLEIVIDVLSTDATRIAAGARVSIDTGNGAPLQGRVRRVEPAAFTKVSALGVEEQRVNVIVEIASPAEHWKALGDGFRIDARIVVQSQDNAVVVPVAALFRQDGGWAVFAVTDGRATRRAVQLGARGGMDAWIQQGLAPGEQVVVYPSDSLTDGARVQIVRGP